MSNITYKQPSRIEDIWNFVWRSLAVIVPLTAVFCALAWYLVSMVVQIVLSVPFPAYALLWMLSVYWSSKYLLMELLWLARLFGTLDGVSSFVGSDTIKIADGQYLKRRSSLK